MYATFCSLYFGFLQYYSSSFSLLHPTESIMEPLDDDKFACDIFADL